MIWLTGSDGMLGREFRELFDSEGIEYTATGRDVDIASEEAVREYIKNRNIRWIINCAAYTKVDLAESEEDKAESINGKGAGNLAAAAEDTGAVIIHFSTDYVFNGCSEKPYKETDATDPVSAYGRTKLSGERQITAATDRFYIFRISWLYGIYGHNFVKAIIKQLREKDELNVVNDQTGSPTYTKILCRNITDMILRNVRSYGIYHYSDKGCISWFDFASGIRDLSHKKGLIGGLPHINPVSSTAFKTAAKRPAWSLMCCDKAENLLNFKINKWDDNLNEYLDTMVMHEKI